MDTPADFFVEPADWRYDQDDLKPIRLAVFVAEQQVPEDEEFDEDDPRSTHFLARDLAGTVIGTARLTHDGRIGRMAVDREWRGAGVGSALLRAALEAAEVMGFAEVRLSSQVHAMRFYERQGFIAEGDVHDEVGIPHRWMRRKLAPLAIGPKQRERREPANVENMPVGRFEGPASYGEAITALIRTTARQLAVFTHDLEPAVLNQAGVVDALQSLLTSGHDPEVRVVVIDSNRALESGHRWIGLGQKRSSALRFRSPPPEFAERVEAFAVADRRHILYRESADQWSGYLRADDPHRARQLLDVFDTAWDHGTPDRNTLRLDL